MNEVVRRIAFRVDASTQIGTGHFMRCLTLADGLRQRGAQVRFVSRHLPEYLCGMLRERGHEFAGLGGGPAGEGTDELAHAHWLGVSQASDAAETARALADRAWDWIIVDHYALDARWESAVRGSATHILAIDDLADRSHDCDILLDDNLLPDFESRYAAKVRPHCRLLLGPAYVPLRDEFLRLRQQARLRDGPVKRILVSFGGIDSENYTSLVIEALLGIQGRDWKIDVVLGARNPHCRQIQDDRGRYNLNCHVQTDRMASLMNDADLAIGAAGYTGYEFVAMKLPAILIPVSGIQVLFAREMENRGVARVPKINRNSTAGEVSAAFLEVIDSAALRSSMSRACAEFIDGKGLVRIVDELLGFKGQA